jgi:hypothetical protein
VCIADKRTHERLCDLVCAEERRVVRAGSPRMYIANLAAARSTVCKALLFAADDGFWNMGKSGVFTMLAQTVAHSGGQFVEGGTAIGAERAETCWAASGEAGKVGALWAGRQVRRKYLAWVNYCAPQPARVN